MSRVLINLVSNIVIPVIHWLGTVTQIGKVIVMIRNPCLIICFSLTLDLWFSCVRNNCWYPCQSWKQSIMGQ